ncbi:MAG: hypothetical protein IPG97_08940 [Microthrixaceae bacterium]|nr:hypothetical protein [Microthrixaceae bacterium]
MADRSSGLIVEVSGGGQLGPGGRREQAVQIVLVAVVAAVVAGAVVFSWFNRRLLIPDPTTWEEGRLVTSTFDPPTNKVELFHNQGDGQFFVHMAQDPFIRQPERIQGGSAEQAYRLQRPLFGWLGWVFTLGDSARAAMVMIGLTVASVALLAAVMAAMATRLGRSPMWGIAVLGFPGVHVDLLRCGPEALGTALLGLSLVTLAPAWRIGPWGVDHRRLSSRRRMLALGMFALAGLTRESFLVVPFVLGVVWWWQARCDRSNAGPAWFGRWGWPFASAVPYLVVGAGAEDLGRCLGPGLGWWPGTDGGADVFGSVRRVDRSRRALADRRGAVCGLDTAAGHGRTGPQSKPGVAFADRGPPRVVGHLRSCRLVHVGRLCPRVASVIPGRAAGLPGPAREARSVGVGAPYWHSWVRTLAIQTNRR